MAKYGEGDKRWIVAERADGRNVHNWHWVERDCLQWSRSTLSSLLSDLVILNGDGGICIRTKSLHKLEGEVYINIRKGKVIPGYELSISISFEAEVRSDCDGFKSAATQISRITGFVEVPYLADENAGEDPEVKIVVRSSDGQISRLIKDAFAANGKPVILEKLRAFVLALSVGGPAKNDLEARKAFLAANMPHLAATVGDSPKNDEIQGFKAITLTERFSCRARDVYDMFMDENSWKEFTHSSARITKEVGGQFSLIDGSITGVNEELQEGKLVVQKWRFSSWANGVHSTVRLDFDEQEPGVTIVKLIQNEIPEEDRFGNSKVIEDTERRWRELIFHKIRELF